MTRLTDRPVVRRALELAKRLSSAVGPIKARDLPATVADTAKFARELEPAALAYDSQSVTRRLYERLADEDVAEVERHVKEALDFPLRIDAGDAASQRWQVLAYGMWLGVSAVAQKTGLVGVQPPDDIHAMARGPSAAAGGLYEADLVVDALASVGVSMDDVRSALDFGCSSARVVRVLAAAYPHARWHGCDPNEAAVAWASANLPGIQFSVNGPEPPLSIADGTLDLVYAISIWSHFEPELGLRWFEEMARIIRPGGHLVFTTHGVTSIAFDATNGFRTPQQADGIAAALYRRGRWYAAEFGEQGDWGVVNPAWGTAFLSPEWLLMELCPSWRVLEFAAGRNQGNQDVYVLQAAP
jgi:SAM-dependent methyltransferase